MTSDRMTARETPRELVKPCPWCHERPRGIIGDIISGYRTVCDCAASGFRAATEGGARDAWNRIARLASLGASLEGATGVPFNVNDKVRVRVTERGWRIFDAGKRALGLDPATYRAHYKQDADGWSEWQLWDLMHTFGEETYMGPPPPFETTIRLVLPPSGANPE